MSELLKKKCQQSLFAITIFTRMMKGLFEGSITASSVVVIRRIVAAAGQTAAEEQTGCCGLSVLTRGLACI